MIDKVKRMGILRPKISLLTDSYKETILDEAMTILESLGVFIENQEAEELRVRIRISRPGAADSRDEPARCVFPPAHRPGRSAPH